MIFAGLQKLTLLDYPAHTACTIFTKGCNFRCPFCHNFDLLDINTPTDEIDRKDIIGYLSERKGKLQGVCLTGGEVLLNDIDDLVKFCREVKDMGYLIKIDTNGYFPDKIKILFEQKLIDYIAMDIKSGKSKYKSTCGVSGDFKYENIEKSIEIIMNSGVEYEFRTTLVKGIHDDNDMYEIKDMIKGAEKYYFQNYRHIDGMKELTYKNFLKDEILHFKDIIGDNVKKCELRGVDG